jgi:hypothetical protein
MRGITPITQILPNSTTFDKRNGFLEVKTTGTKY